MLLLLAHCAWRSISDHFGRRPMLGFGPRRPRPARRPGYTLAVMSRFAAARRKPSLTTSA